MKAAKTGLAVRLLLSIHGAEEKLLNEVVLTVTEESEGVRKEELQGKEKSVEGKEREEVSNGLQRPSCLSVSRRELRI